MLIAIIHTCEDRFSHTPMRLVGTYIEGEYSRRQIQEFVSDYKSRFQLKRFSALKVMMVDILPETSTVDILENLDLKNELPKRTVINPSKKNAFPASTKLKNPVQFGEFVFTPPPMQWVDENGAT